jgi:hypothetical protein
LVNLRQIVATNQTRLMTTLSPCRAIIRPMNKMKYTLSKQFSTETPPQNKFVESYKKWRKQKDELDRTKDELDQKLHKENLLFSWLKMIGDVIMIIIGFIIIIYLAWFAFCLLLISGTNW